jgi:hypothetical protein
VELIEEFDCHGTRFKNFLAKHLKHFALRYSDHRNLNHIFGEARYYFETLCIAAASNDK